MEKWKREELTEKISRRFKQEILCPGKVISKSNEKRNRTVSEFC